MVLSPFDSSEKSHSVLARAERGSEIPLQVHHSPAKSACEFNFYSENIDEGRGDDKSRVKRRTSGAEREFAENCEVCECNEKRQLTPPDRSKHCSSASESRALYMCKI
jgi:hypothetical protein